MHPVTVATIAILVIALAMPHGAALHCNGDITTIGTGAATLYLDDRSTTTGDINHWLYLESNGIDGLQSGHDVICPSLWCDTPLAFVDACAHAKPDTLIL